MNWFKNIFYSFFDIFAEKSQSFIKGLYAKTIIEGPAAGLKICVFGTPKGYVKGHIEGTYEKPIQNILTKLLHSGDVVYDIGANYGFFSLLAAKMVQQPGQVYAFEPVPQNAAMIQLNARLNSFHHVKVIALAVSDKEETQQIWLTHHPGGATLTSIGVIPPDKVSKLKVKTVSIDILIDRGELHPPSLMKIDVEGAELLVLHGMSKTLRKYTPIVIYEIDDSDEQSFSRKIEQAESLLKTFGYGVTRLVDAYPPGGWHVAHFIAEPRHRLTPWSGVTSPSSIS
jgi:FkbM family methyltransferase